MSAGQDLAHGAEPVRDHPVATLVVRAGNGDELAWDALVERYAPLIWSLCRRFGLGGAGAADVGQNVWLQLVNQLGQDPRPGRAPGLARHHNLAGMKRLPTAASSLSRPRHWPPAAWQSV